VAWYGLYPQKPSTDFAFWWRVAMRVREKRVRHKDRVKILMVCLEIEKEMRK